MKLSLLFLLIVKVIYAYCRKNLEDAIKCKEILYKSHNLTKTEITVNSLRYILSDLFLHIYITINIDFFLLKYDHILHPFPSTVHHVYLFLL